MNNENIYIISFLWDIDNFILRSSSVIYDSKTHNNINHTSTIIRTLFLVLPFTNYNTPTCSVDSSLFFNLFTSVAPVKKKKIHRISCLIHLHVSFEYLKEKKSELCPVIFFSNSLIEKEKKKKKNLLAFAKKKKKTHEEVSSLTQFSEQTKMYMWLKNCYF